MKKIFVLLIICISLLSACNKDDSLSIGKYTGSNQGESVKYPCVELKENNEFVFTYSLYNSYFTAGKYEVENNTLILTTTDKLYKYFFNIDGNTLIFNASESSPIPEFENKQAVTNGMVFVHKG